MRQLKELTDLMAHAGLAYSMFAIFLCLLPVFLLVLIADLPGRFAWKSRYASEHNFRAIPRPKALPATAALPAKVSNQAA
jgi:hypothetical protein